MSSYLSNGALLELVALAMAEKNNVKVYKSSIQFSQNYSIAWFEQKVSIQTLTLIA